MDKHKFLNNYKIKKIIIVGSGSNKKIVPKKKNYYICCNSSILRFLKTNPPQCLAISESIIGNKKKIFNSKKNIIGLNKSQSMAIRKNKINFLKRVKCETLLVYSNSRKKEIKKKIIELGIKYKYIIAQKNFIRNY